MNHSIGLTAELSGRVDRPTALLTPHLYRSDAAEDIDQAPCLNQVINCILHEKYDDQAVAQYPDAAG